MSNAYPPDPYSQSVGQPSSYDPYQQAQSYQQYSQQPIPGMPGSYSPYQPPQEGYQQYSQPVPGAYGSTPYNQPQIIVNVQQGQNQSQQQMQPLMVAVAPQTNGKATAALVLGILSWIGLSILTGIPAIILGHMALSEINNSRGLQNGRGMAITGLVLGYLSVAGAVCACLYFIVVLGALSTTPS